MNLPSHLSFFDTKSLTVCKKQPGHADNAAERANKAATRSATRVARIRQPRASKNLVTSVDMVAPFGLIVIPRTFAKGRYCCVTQAKCIIC